MNSPEDDEHGQTEGDGNLAAPSVDSSVSAPQGYEEQQEVSEDNGDVVPTSKLERLADQLPPPQREELLAVIHREQHHSGWLPTPEFLRQYEEVLPGLAERIVAMPEREQGFRHQSTNDVIKRDYKLRGTGQWMAMASLVIILAFCVFLAMLGFPTQAASVAVATIVGTVGVFVTGQITGSKDDGTTSKEAVEKES